MQQQPPPYAYNPQPMPPPQPYPPLPQHYPPGYVQPHPMYAPPMQQLQQQQQTSVFVVNAGAPAPTTTIIRERSHVNHVLHCIITFFFFPWVIVWIILCIADS
ncbi:protein SPEC3-like [Haliotis rufescens]|uniref:protein SPEC3-like n=1 Tax=Haliotis rufescens TaxID=6454 RepID=UPI001EAFFBC3|nr:protein SPEC3-like [Haliotis rufescens]